MAVPDESDFVSVLGRVRTRYERPFGFITSAFLNDLFQQRSFRRWRMTREYLLDQFDAHPPLDYPDAVRALFCFYARRQGKARYADKTPRNLRNIELLAELFPEAKFVHIIRDGRDVALSLLDVDFGARDIGAAALAWKEFVTEGRASGKRLGIRYCEINYENILEDPESTIVSLCEFIDLPFDSKMLRYFERSEKITAPAAWSRRHVLLPPTKGLRDWRIQMMPKDVAVFETLAGNLLDELGYERSVHKASTTELLRARGKLLRRKVGGLARRARMSTKRRSEGRAEPPSPLFSHPGSDRQEVLSFLLAQEASKDPEVNAFRKHTLRDRLLSLENATAWIVDQAQQDGVGGPAPTLEYVGADGWPLRQPTIEGSVLDRLRLLAARLAPIYGWEQSQASTFVLTGLTPLASAIRSTTIGGLPFSSTLRIVLEVDPAVTPGDLIRFYTRIRKRVAQERSGRVTEKQCKLVVFVAERSEQEWPELMETWNAEFPQWLYENTKSFQRDAVSARRRVLDPY
jgi:Sulfotransferase family